MTASGDRSRAGAVLSVPMVLLLAACQSAPADPFHAGEQAMRAGQLPTALCHFDGVPVIDARYPEARLAAAALERRLRRQQELLLTGLRLRGEWRDEEAATVFREALAAWPGNEQVAMLLAATEARQRTLELFATEADAGEREMIPSPAAPEPQPEVVVVAPAARTPDAEAVAAEIESRLMLPSVARQLADVASPEAAAALADLEARLAAGKLEAALEELVVLQRTYPNDPRIAGRLARVLQQRGLMRYGQGNVAGALTDWQRALDLDPSLRSTRGLLDHASRELAAPVR